MYLNDAERTHSIFVKAKKSTLKAKIRKNVRRYILILLEFTGKHSLVFFQNLLISVICFAKQRKNHLQHFIFSYVKIEFQCKPFSRVN